MMEYVTDRLQAAGLSEKEEDDDVEAQQEENCENCFSSFNVLDENDFWECNRCQKRFCLFCATKDDQPEMFECDYCARICRCCIEEDQNRDEQADSDDDEKMADSKIMLATEKMQLLHCGDKMHQHHPFSQKTWFVDSEHIPRDLRHPLVQPQNAAGEESTFCDKLKAVTKREENDVPFSLYVVRCPCCKKRPIAIQSDNSSIFSIPYIMKMQQTNNKMFRTHVLCTNQ